MTPDQRAEALRQKAVEARTLAMRTHSDATRADLLSLASQFDRLADEIDRRDAEPRSDMLPDRRND